MTEYRKLPHGTEMIGTLGLGMGGIQSAPPEEIEAVVSQAIENGINFFDLCAGGASVYEPFGRAIRGKRYIFSSTSARSITPRANTAGRAIFPRSGAPSRGR